VTRDNRGFGRRKFLKRACEIAANGTEIDLKFYVRAQELKYGTIVLDELVAFTEYLAKEGNVSR